MKIYDPTYQLIQQSHLADACRDWPERVAAKFDPLRYGDLPKWLSVLDQLPDVKPSNVQLSSDAIMVGSDADCDPNTRDQLELLLREMMPWRKGPFNLFGLDIDTEWRSDLKWNRLKSHISSLKDRYVLDVGCGNGYHCWRMHGEGARMVIGIDPTILYVMQFQVLQKYIQEPHVAVLPLGIDDLPRQMQGFDTVFSMGLLYHRRAPFDHLIQLKECLRPDGELVLETIVIEGRDGDVLSPKGRYAKMKNVWFIPSVKTLEGWLARIGFRDIQTVDVTRTTSDEQRVTPWIGSQSLANFLDPENPMLTVEGYPAPIRAVVIARA